jgi:hypothetical protein
MGPGIIASGISLVFKGYDFLKSKKQSKINEELIAAVECLRTVIKILVLLQVVEIAALVFLFLRR